MWSASDKTVSQQPATNKPAHQFQPSIQGDRRYIDPSQVDQLTGQRLSHRSMPALQRAGEAVSQNGKNSNQRMCLVLVVSRVGVAASQYSTTPLKRRTSGLTLTNSHSRTSGRFEPPFYREDTLPLEFKMYILV